MADSYSRHWCTPKEYVEAAHIAFKARPELDPFTNLGARTFARRGFIEPGVDQSGFDLCAHGGVTEYIETDGFAADWGGRVIFNPPWKRSGESIRKALAEYDAERVREAVAIIPVSTSSKHWPLMEQRGLICYPHKRPSFVNPETGKEVKGNPKDVAVWYLGPRVLNFRLAFEHIGRFHK